IVSSTVPRLDERWPPVWLTESIMKARSSSASCASWRRSRARNSAGLLIVFSSSYIAGSDSCLPCGSCACSLFTLNFAKKISYLEPAQHDEIGELAQARSRCAERRQRRMRLGTQFLGQGARTRQPQYADISRLRLRGVLAGRFSQGGGAGGAIEHVVHHLERQTHRLGIAFQPGKVLCVQGAAA